MLRNYFVIAWRSLLKDKQFSTLNVLGLSAGLACTLLIFLWVNDELNFDRFFTNEDRMYRLLEQRTVNGITSHTHESSGRLSDAVKQALPEVAYAAAVAPASWFPPKTLSVGDKNIKANVQYADKDYFNIFSFTLLEGEKTEVLSTKSAIVLSDELAIKLFGTTHDIIGKPVVFDHDTTFYVSGVFKKMSANSSQQFDFLLPFDYFRAVKDWVTYWDHSGPHNFVLLKEETSGAAFNKNVENIIANNTGNKNRKVVGVKFSDGYLHNHYGDSVQSGERIQYVKLFTALAAFILVIACINFMNLSTAKASRRLKEVGIKKVVGARRGQLIVQFLTESILLTLFALVIALAVATILLPQFNQLTGKTIELRFTWQLVSGIILIVLITGILAGSYPALYISGFNPLAILKGKLKTSTAELLSRKGLVVFQFTLSTILIVAVTVIYQQVNHIKNMNLGYNKENIVRFTAEGRIQNSQQAFLAEMQQLSGVTNAAYTYHSIIGRSYSTGNVAWSGMHPDDQKSFEIFGISHNFIETMGMDVKAGRSFSSNFELDSLNIILNQSAAKAMNIQEPVGTIIRFQGSERTVIGVVDDFHFESMHETVKPAIMQLQRGEGTIVARIKQDNQRETLASIESLYKKYNPNFPFTYNFLDEAYQRQYDSETRTATLSGYFAALGIIISCLGLFGLAAFTAQKRKKEIGIRKVIGASSFTITAMLSKDFLKLVGLALLIAFPVSWWLMNDWLQNYAYRVEIRPGIFIIAGTIVMIITMMAISAQTIKAALANPVKNLRTE